jgi:penicillin-binding protein 1A
VNVGGDWMYEEYAKGGAISTLGTGGDGSGQSRNAIPPAEERNRILDLFRN